MKYIHPDKMIGFMDIFEGIKGYNRIMDLFNISIE
jgi:hypothetical protein